MNADGGGAELLTDTGPAAIAIFRIWGPTASCFREQHLQSSLGTPLTWRPAGQVVRARLVQGEELLDDILVSFHGSAEAPEIRVHLHGNPVLVARVRSWLPSARPADAPALWNAADFLEVEAIRSLPGMRTLRGVRWLLAQPPRLRKARDQLRTLPADMAQTEWAAIAARRHIARRFEQPLRLVLAGPPNAGKSTLANALADRPVAVVSDRPGTTRDWIGFEAELAGFPVEWIDTAGLRSGDDALEAAAMARTRELAARADAVVVVLDGRPEAAAVTAAFVQEYAGPPPAAVVWNKADACGVQDHAARCHALLPPTWAARAVVAAAQIGLGLDVLLNQLATVLCPESLELDAPAAFSEVVAMRLADPNWLLEKELTSQDSG